MNISTVSTSKVRISHPLMASQPKTEVQNLIKLDEQHVGFIYIKIRSPTGRLIDQPTCCIYNFFTKQLHHEFKAGSNRSLSIMKFILIRVNKHLIIVEKGSKKVLYDWKKKKVIVEIVDFIKKDIQYDLKYSVVMDNPQEEGGFFICNKKNVIKVVYEPDNENKLEKETLVEFEIGVYDYRKKQKSFILSEKDKMIVTHKEGWCEIDLNGSRKINDKVPWGKTKFSGNVTTLISPDVIVANKDLSLQLNEFRLGGEETKDIKAKGHSQPIDKMVFVEHLGSSVLFTGSADYTVIIWDIITWQPIHKLYGHTNAIVDIAILQKDDTSILFATASEYEILIWKMELADPFVKQLFKNTSWNDITIYCQEVSKK